MKFILAIILGFVGYSIACTTIIVGKNASVNGTVLIGRNVDTANPNKAVRLIYHPPHKKSYQYNSKISNKFSYQIPANSLSYFGVPDWNTDTFEEVGINSQGIGVSATETIFSNKKTLALDPYVENGVNEEAIPSILLPQIKDAKSGIILLGKLIQTYGSSEGFGVAIADKKEAWYLENAGGHRWVAVRIPDNGYFVTANQSRISQINLADPRYFLGSDDLISFALKNELYKPSQDGEFNFSKVYGKDDEDDKTYSYMRVLTLQAKYTPSLKQKIKEHNNYPMFLKPDKKLSVYDIEEGLQNYYQNSQYDPYTNKNPEVTYRPISVYRAQQSHVLELSNGLPLPIANVMYLSLGMPSLSVYVPFYQGIKKIPDVYKIATDKADNFSMFWRLKKLQMLAMQDFPKYAPIVEQKFMELSNKIKEEQGKFEIRYRSLYSNKKLSAANKLLNKFTSNMTNLVAKEVDELINQIVTEESMYIGNLYSFTGA